MKIIVKRAVRFAALGVVFFMLCGVAFAAREFELALLHYAKGEYNETLKALEEYTSAKPDPEAYYLMGYALYNLKRFDEANRYFRDAYLLDPEFSPRALIKEIDTRKALAGIKPTVKKRPKAVKREAAPPAGAVIKPQPAPPKPVESVSKPEPAKPPVEKPAEQPLVKPAVKKPDAPSAMPLPFSPLYILIAGVLFYLLLTAPFFVIARKLDVSAPWLAFIPVAQIITFVKAADKPVWWMLLLLVPLVNAVIAIYMWMIIADRLGKSKIFGVLMILPGINIIILILLAVTGKKISAMPAMGEFPADFSSSELPDLPEPPGFGQEESTGTGEDFNPESTESFDFPDSDESGETGKR